MTGTIHNRGKDTADPMSSEPADNGHQETTITTTSRTSRSSGTSRSGETGTSRTSTSRVDRAEIDRIIASLAASAVDREHERTLPTSELSALVEAGIGAIRVPREFGGAGGSIRELAEVLIELAAADSNLTMILRAHVTAVEDLLLRPRDAAVEELLTAAADRELFGPAGTELGGTSLIQLKARLYEEDGQTFLEGQKYYTTGSLFADRVWVMVPHDGGFAGVFVDRHDPGIEILDDWSGFGQRVTASGTATFKRVEVRPEFILPFADPEASEYIPAFSQLVHSATQAGIAQRLRTDLADVVRRRSRAYPHAPQGVAPPEDPQVLQVVGEIGAGAFTTRANVLLTAEHLDDYADPERRARTPDALATAIAASSSTQITNTRLLGELSWHFFDAASASTTLRELALDRHWRNARTVSSHNPAMYKARVLGEYLVHGTLLNAIFPGATRETATDGG